MLKQEDSQPQHQIYINKLLKQEDSQRSVNPNIKSFTSREEHVNKLLDQEDSQHSVNTYTKSFTVPQVVKTGRQSMLSQQDARNTTSL